MLNIDSHSLSNVDQNYLTKQRTSFLILSVLLLLGGIFCLINPFASGVALSVIVGILFILSGIGLIISFAINRAKNFWPMIAGVLLGIAYIIMGYVFITKPLVGMLTMSLFLTVLFAVGGIIRLISGFKLRKAGGAGVQIFIGILDLVIAALFITAGPLMSITLLTTLVGIEMLFSSFGCFQISTLFKKPQS